MTVTPDNPNRRQYTATAGQTVFSYTSKIFVATDLNVYKTLAGNVFNAADLLTEGTDYTVSGVGNNNGGNVTLLVGAAVNDIITINRAVPETQETDYSVDGTFTGQSVENAFDKLTVLLDQVRSLVEDTGLTYQIGEVLGVGQTTIPKLGNNQFWRANGIGDIAAVDLVENPDVSTLRSELISQTVGAPGTDNIGVYNPRTTTGQTLTSWIQTYTAPMDDSVSLVRDPIDNTKQMRIDAGSITTATTRVLTMADKDINLTPASQAEAIAGTIDNKYLTPKTLHDGSTVILQRVSVSDSVFASGITAMADDNSIPQNTEGDEYMTLSITPKRNDSTLKIEVIIVLGSETSAQNISIALFQDAIVGALAAVSQTNFGIGDVMTTPLTFSKTSGSTSAQTYKIRAGSRGAAGTVNFNGKNGVQIFGGISASTITITEYI